MMKGRTALGRRILIAMTAATVAAEKIVIATPAYTTILSKTAKARISTLAHADCRKTAAVGPERRCAMAKARGKTPSRAIAKYTRGPAIIIALADDRIASAMSAATILAAGGPNMVTAAVSAIAITPLICGIGRAHMYSALSAT